MRWHEQDHGTGITQMIEGDPIHRVDSPYQRIEVFGTRAFGKVLVLDGTVQASEAEECIYHEMAIHVPLLGKKRAAARVLIVGGGDGGLVREALRHAFVARIVMVEIDPDVISVSNELMGIQGDYTDPRVQVVTEDAAEWILRAGTEGERFDVIVIDATDSTSPSKVLWTHTFYAQLVSLLAEGGVIVDSDILIPGKAGPSMSRDPCEVSVFDLMKSKRHFRRIESYLTKSPLYPGGYFAFFLYTLDGASHGEPEFDFVGRHYNPQLHRAAFVLPVWWRRLLDELK